MAESPAHYTRGSIEVWDFIRDQELNYHLGNAVKYICRAGYKDSKVQDLKKAIHYLENELLHTHEFDGSSGRVSLRLRPPQWTDEEVDPESFDR
ncbi:MAG: hypothetical protein Unbinned8622contig1003_31 [Prokaryotic dsDNA virus sp.]|nr:MAG: hypothetical protein Unbinned8622contig1003_31 [Prokaryotic dsDNA virus sp.]